MWFQGNGGVPKEKVAEGIRGNHLKVKVVCNLEILSIQTFIAEAKDRTCQRSF